MWRRLVARCIRNYPPVLGEISADPARLGSIPEDSWPSRQTHH
jgi:hypothetical protein